MKNQDWIELIRLFPEAEQNTLVLTTISGVDLNVEMILRTEPNYLVFRGRVSGQLEDGRAFFLPYSQIDFLQMNREVREVEIRSIYGERIEDLRALRDSAILSPPTAEPEMAAELLPATPSSPSTPVPVVAARPSSHHLPLRATPSVTSPGQRPVNVPAAALHPNPAMAQRNANAADQEDEATPRNSILERLRAQRNSAMPQKPRR